MSRQLVHIILVALIPFALLEAWWMTPDFDYYKPMDFAVFYSASRAFLHHQNPYDRTIAQQIWTDNGGDWWDDDTDVMDMVLGTGYDDQPPEEHWLPVEVIPPGLLVFGAIAAFQAKTAWTIYNAVVVLLLIGQTYALIRLIRRPLWDAASLAIIVLTLLLEPLHIGLANGQPTVPTVSLLVMTLWFSRSGRPWVAGFCFAIATALKPQLAAPFVMLLIFQRRWATVGVAALIGIALTAIAAGRMQHEQLPWVSSWMHEVHYAEQSDGIDNARTTNPGRHDLLYLGLIGHLFTDNATVVNIAAFTTFFALTAGLFWIGRRDRESLAVMAAFSVLTLMPMYHRYYDAFILVIPLGWALVNRTGPYRAAAFTIYVITAVFYVSQEWFNQSVFLNIAKNHTTAAASWWFNDVMEPHHAWELLAIAGAIGWAVWHAARHPRQVESREVAFVPPGWWWRNGWRLAVCALIPLALCEAWWIAPDADNDDYKYRGPMDFAMYYTAGRMFDHGQNPYNRKRSVMNWDDADTDGQYWDIMVPILGDRTWNEESAPEDWLPVNLMPAGVAIMASIAWMTVPYAWPTWNAAIALLLVGQIWSINRLMRVPVWDWRTLLVIALMFLLEPLHVGLANGQPAVPAVALTTIALWLASINRQTLAGIALAFATAFKPQLAGPFLVFFLWQKQWRLSVVAVATGVVLTLIAVVPMQVHHLPWLTNWIGELKYAEIPGGINDPRMSDSGRDDMMHLQLFFHAFTDNGFLATALAWTVVISLGGAVLALSKRRHDLLGVMSCFAVLALLPMYHRIYDGGILIVPIAWAVMNITGPRRWPAGILLAVVSVFFVSQQWLDDWFIDQSGQDWTVSSWWFNTLAEPHHPLELLVILGCLMRGLAIGDVHQKAGGSAGFPVVSALAG